MAESSTSTVQAAESPKLTALAQNILDELQEQDAKGLEDPALSLGELSDAVMRTEDKVADVLRFELEPAGLVLEVEENRWRLPVDPEDIGEAGWVAEPEPEPDYTPQEHPALDRIVAPAEPEPEAVASGWSGSTLTNTESALLTECESVIERGLQGFIEVGEALLGIRDGRLYRATYTTFEDYCRERWGMSRPYAYQVIAASEASRAVSAMADIQPPASERQARPLTKLPTPEAQREAWQEAVETAPEGRVTAAHVEAVVERRTTTVTSHAEPEPAAPAHAARRTDDRQTWATPQALFDVLDAEFGFTLDAAAAHDNHKCTRYFTAADDGLVKSWSKEVVFCNPPYGDKETWVRKAWSEAANFGATVVMLIPVGTGTKLWRGYCRYAEVRFITGRLRFDDGGQAAPFDSALIIFRPGQNGSQMGHWQIWDAWQANGGDE